MYPDPNFNLFSIIGYPLQQYQWSYYTGNFYQVIGKVTAIEISPHDGLGRKVAYREEKGCM